MREFLEFIRQISVTVPRDQCIFLREYRMHKANSDLFEFSRYYEQHSKGVFNYIFYRIGFNRHIAEDLTSEIFLKAFEHFDQYDRNRPFKTWIFGIAHNHLVNFFIAKKELLSLDEAKVMSHHSSIEEIDTKMKTEQLLALVNGLPPFQRDLLIMRYVNDLSNREIAEILKKEEGAVRTALSRALALLRNNYNLVYAKNK